MKSLAKLRAQSLELKNHKHFVGKAFFRSIYFFWSIIKLLINPRYRSEQYTRNRYAKRIIQVSTYTKENRYPVLFNQIREELKNIENPKILSFGCSTGEEVFSLKRIIPDAEITGVDINYWCIKKAKKNNQYLNCTFFHTSCEKWKTNQYYDCILALAVFQKSIHRSPGRWQTLDSFGFDDFEKEVIALSRCLRTNGIFILEHSDFRFNDLGIFDQEFIPRGNKLHIRSRPYFDKRNQKISGSFYIHRIFKKIS